MGQDEDFKKLLSGFGVEPYLETNSGLRALFHFAHLDGRVAVELDPDNCHLTIGIDVDWQCDEHEQILAEATGDKAALLLSHVRESQRPLLRRLVQDKTLVECGPPVRTTCGLEYTFALCGDDTECAAAFEEFLRNSHLLGGILPSQPGPRNTTAKKTKAPPGSPRPSQ